MSAATLRTSSNRSFSYRLWVNPRPVRATAESVSAQRSRSTADGLNGSVTAVRPNPPPPAPVERHPPGGGGPGGRPGRPRPGPGGRAGAPDGAGEKNTAGPDPP